MPARTGHARVHSAKYKEDSSPSDNSDIGQSVASVSTLLTDKTTPGHRYVTPVWLSTTQVLSSLMDGCTITPTTMWGPQRGVRSPTLTGSYAPDPTSGGRGNRIPTPGAGSPRWDYHPPRTVTSRLLPATMIASKPYRAGELVSNHHSRCAAMAGTVPPPYATPWRKEQAEDDHTST